MTLKFEDPQLSRKILPKTANTKLGVIEYVEIGSGPAVVALHGVMGGYDQSLILAQTICEPKYRFLAVSRPGYLGTPISSGKSGELQGDLIAALLDALEIEKAGIVAVSGGGPAALHFGLRHPQRCNGLVLAATYADTSDFSIPFSFNIMKAAARWTLITNQLRRNAKRHLAAVAGRSIRDPEILNRTINDPDTWPIFSTMMLSIYDRMGERIVGTDNDIAISKTATYPLEKLSVPVMTIHGTNDLIVDYEKHAKAYARRVPNIEAVTVKGGEHVSIFTHRDEARKAVTDFMRRLFLPHAC